MALEVKSGRTAVFRATLIGVYVFTMPARKADNLTAIFETNA
jgi:hypothetical protein